MNLRYKYSGQALAIVLVILMVGVIIALAMMSRTFSTERRTREEDLSADAIEMADTVLDSVKSVDMEELAAWAEDPAGSPCNPDNLDDYNFYLDGCRLRGLEQYQIFVEHFELQEYYDSVEDLFANQCADADLDNEDILKLIVTPIDSEEEIPIDKDKVFSIMVRSPNAPNCQMQISAVSGGAGAVGAIYTPVYATVTDGEVTEYKNYEVSDIFSQCLSTSCHDWGINWQQFTDTPQVEYIDINSGGHSLYEMRIRAIGGQIAIKRDFVETASGGCDNVKVDDMMKVQSLITCGDEFRGKQVILTQETWAPAIFDYVLFNGQGTLDIAQ